MAVDSGGGGFGAELEIRATTPGVDEASKKLEALKKTLLETGKAAEQVGAGFAKTASGLIVPDDVSESIDAVTESYEEAAKAAEQLEKDNAFKAHQEAARAAARETKEATNEVKKFAEANQNASARVKELQAERKKQREPRVAEDFGGGILLPVDDKEVGKLNVDLLETAKRLKQINQEAKTLVQQLGKTAAEPGLAKLRLEAERLHAATGTVFQGFPEAANKSAQELSAVGRATAIADNFLGKFGLNTRQVAILLGAGLAGGITFVLRELLAFGQRINENIGILDDLEKQSRRTFGGASDVVTDFANNTDQALNASRAAVLETANAFGLLAERMELTQAAAAQFATAYTQVAAAILAARPGFKDLQDVQATIAQAVTGSTDALLKLGINATEFARLSQEAFGKLPDQLTPAEREFIILNEVAEAAGDQVAKSGQKTISVGQRLKDIFSGKTIAEGFIAVRDAVNEMRLENLEKAAREGNALAVSQSNLKKFTLEFLQGLREEAAGHEDVIALIDAEVQRRKELGQATEDNAKAALSAIDIQKRNIELFLQSTSAINSAIDAFRNLSHAQEDGARAVARANEQLRRTREDNLHKAVELAVRSERAGTDAAIKVSRAEQNLEDIREQQRLKLEDVREKRKEDLEKDFRAEREILERLSDLRRDHARREFDLKLRISRARKDLAKDTIEAEVSIRQAQQKGDLEAEDAAQRSLSRIRNDTSAKESLADAERALAREREDFAIDQARLQRDLQELKDDNAKKQAANAREVARAELEAKLAIRHAEEQLADARRDAARAAEDAARNLARLEVENNRALADAMRGIDDAERNMERSVAAATLAIQRMAIELGITVEKLKELVAILNLERSGVLQLPQFRHGGYLSGAGIVGEDGPELFVPDRAGRVFSNADLERLIEAIKSGGINRSTSSPNITINKVVDSEATAFAVLSRITQGLN